VRTSLAGTIVVLVTAAAPVGAQAQLVEADVRHPVEAGPALAGAALAYVPDHGREVVSVHVASGGEERALARIEAAPPFPDDRVAVIQSASATVRASRDSLVVRMTTQFSHPDGSPMRWAVQSFAGPPSGPLKSQSPACESSSLQAFPELGADGSSVAVTGPICGEESVLDVSTGARRPLPPAARGNVQVAGDLTAWLEPAGPDPPPSKSASAKGVIAVVIDAFGRELLRTFAPGALLRGTDLDLAPDGTIAVFGRLDDNQLRDPIVATASLADSALREVAMPPDTAAVRQVRLAAGRLAVLRGVKGRNQLTSGEVTLMSAQGADPRTVLRGVDAHAGGMDFDGDQVAATARACNRILLVRHTVDEPVGRAPTPRKCPLELAEPPRLTSTGVRVKLACGGFAPASCTPQAIVARIHGPGVNLIPRLRPTFRTRTFTLILKPGERRRLRSSPRARLFLSARIADRSGERSAPRRKVTAAIRLR
jgi:hypothetical protein